jgi:hypothetical protein
MACIVILIIACNNQTKDENENPYVGAWQYIDTKYVLPDTTYTRTDTINMYHVKLLTKKNTIWALQTPGKEIRAGGGEYLVKPDSFLSAPKFHWMNEVIGDTIRFKSKIEGELWTLSQDRKVYRKQLNDTLRYTYIESWKRIPE